MAALLPDDLLHMICHQLGEQRDFDTLYHCSCAGKQLAVPALASIYRYIKGYSLIQRPRIGAKMLQYARRGASHQRLQR